VWAVRVAADQLARIRGPTPVSLSFVHKLIFRSLSRYRSLKQCPQPMRIAVRAVRDSRQGCLKIHPTENAYMFSLFPPSLLPPVTFPLSPSAVIMHVITVTRDCARPCAGFNASRVVCVCAHAYLRKCFFFFSLTYVRHDFKLLIKYNCSVVVDQLRLIYTRALLPYNYYINCFHGVYIKKKKSDRSDLY